MEAIDTIDLLKPMSKRNDEVMEELQHYDFELMANVHWYL